jgi:hypothetical protein
MIPSTVRQRVLADPNAIDLYAQLLHGRHESGRHWDTTVVLWWLAESGQPTYAPLFSQYADSTRHRLGIVQMALYGLARTASVDASASRLRVFSRSDRPIVQQMTIAALMTVNDTITRALLREVPTDRIPATQHALVVRALATPALSHGEGHLFCPPTEAHAVANDGRFRCTPPSESLPAQPPHHGL